MVDFERVEELEAAMAEFISGGRMDMEPVIREILDLARNERELIIGGRYDETADDMFAVIDPQEGKNYLTVFTSLKAMNYTQLGGAPRDTAFILRLAYLEDDDSLDGIVLNARQENVILTREMIGEILEVLDAEEEQRQAALPILCTRESPGWEWLPEGVTVAVRQGTVLSEEAKRIFLHFEHYSDGERSFVMYGDHVGQIFIEDDPLSDAMDRAKALWEMGENAMAESLSYHPDFSDYTMDDCTLAVQLFSDVWCFHEPEDFGIPRRKGHLVTFPVAMVMRDELLECCERGQVLLAAMHLNG